MSILLLHTALAMAQAAPPPAIGTIADDRAEVTSPATANPARPLRLSPPRERANDPTTPLPSHRQTGTPNLWTIGGSLAVVLGLFLLTVWIMRRGMPAASAKLPTEVVDVLGRTVLLGKQQLQLVRCGHKLVLLSVTPAGAEALTEITDSAEVDRLVGLCEQQRPGSSSATFRTLLDQFDQEEDRG